MTQKINMSNLKLVNLYYVAEILGKDAKGNPIMSKVSQTYKFLADAEDARRRMYRRDKGNYKVIQTA